MTSESTSATKTEYTVIVAKKGPEFLMVRHRDRGWELPGGKLEGKEGPVHCALREFREETGHGLDDPRFVLKMEKDNGTCWVFTGSLGPKVQSRSHDEAVEEMAWFTHLPEDLAFPDDPYDAIGDALGIRFEPVA